MATTTTEHIRSRVLANVAAVGIVDGLSNVLFEQRTVDEDRCIDPPGKIRRHLYIGSRETECCLSALKTAGISHILQVGGELRPTFPHHFVYKRLSVGDEDDEDMVATFKEAFDFIDEGRKSGAVLIHCAQGQSRSATIAIGYLMWRERLSFDTALAHVQQARSAVDPNEGFTLQLKEFERLKCNLSLWRGWDKQRLERCFKRCNVSGRRVVHGYSDIIRRFHVHSLTDDDTVFFDSTVMF